MIGTLMTTCYVMDVVFYLWYCCVMFYLLSLKSHSLGKVFRCSFLVTTRKVISRRDMAGMARHGVNYWLIDIPIGRDVTLVSVITGISLVRGFARICEVSKHLHPLLRRTWNMSAD
jgi:hypothetical protein